MRIGFPRDRDRVADDVARDVDLRIDLLQRIECQLDALFHRLRQHLQRVAHPRIRQADHAGLAGAVVEQVGAAGQPVGQRHAHHVAAGGGVHVFPERPVDHHEGLGTLHVAGAVECHPQLLREQRLFAFDLRRQQPALAGRQARRRSCACRPSGRSPPGARRPRGRCAPRPVAARPNAATRARCRPASAPSARAHAPRCRAAPARRHRRRGAGPRRNWSSRHAGSRASNSGSRSPSLRCRSRPGRRPRGAGTTAAKTPATRRRSHRRCGRPTAAPVHSTTPSGAARRARGSPPAPRRTRRLPAAPGPKPAPPRRKSGGRSARLRA